MSYSRSNRSLEIELISAEGLKVNRKPMKRKTFGVIRIDQEIHKCKVDEQGGSYPIWKERIKTEMAVDRSVRFISVEVCYITSGGAVKNVGVAKIPLTDFLGGFAPQGHLNFLSYRLRDEYGDKSGIVNVSILVKPDVNDVKYASPSPLTVPSMGYTACSSQAAAAAVNGQMWRRPMTSSSMATTFGYGSRVVTGVPVNWGAYHRPT
ncbi:BON1-associated protein 2 [Hirschfeldia incana]|nr:BON1-associated protein 2 [Hirschfeldia incana]